MRILLSLIFFVGIKCDGQKFNSFLSGKYFGVHTQSSFIYHFQKDMSFSFSTSGHFGQTKTLGHYTINKDTIFLKSFLLNKQPNKNSINILDTLLIDGDSCIISLFMGYDYCKQKSNQKYFHNSRQRFLTKSDMLKEDND